MFQQSGEERLFQQSGEGRLFQQSGEDRLFQQSGEERLFQQSGEDRLFQQSGEERLFQQCREESMLQHSVKWFYFQLMLWRGNTQHGIQMDRNTMYKTESDKHPFWRGYTKLDATTLGS